VDFIISSGRSFIPLEVKYKVLKSPEVGRSFRSFITKYNPEKAFIVSLNYKDSIEINNTEILFLPYYQLENVRGVFT
jgi:hypothetical protein